MHNTNCPNCGAIIDGPKCEYCGTVFSNHASPCRELKKLELDNILLRQRIEMDRLNHLYTEALQAMRRYSM